MAIELIPNQLVKLYDTENFNQRNKRLTWDYRQYCQIVRDEQTTQFQLRLTAATGANLVTNGDFALPVGGGAPTGWIVGTGWTSDNDLGRCEITGAFNPTLMQPITVVANTWYKFTFEIVQMVGSSGQEVVVSVADPSAGLAIIENIAIDKATYGSTPGVFNLYFDSSSLTSVYIIFAYSGDVGDILTIDNVSIEALTTPVVTLEDTGGTTIETLTPFARALDVITYQVEWAEKTEQQYRICITGVDDLDLNYLDNALALATEGDEPIELEQGGELKWYG